MKVEFTFENCNAREMEMIRQSFSPPDALRDEIGCNCSELKVTAHVRPLGPLNQIFNIAARCDICSAKASIRYKV